MEKAYVLIVNESGTEDSVISNLNHIPSITNAFGTFGTYDILTKLESPDEQTIRHDISNGIRAERVRVGCWTRRLVARRLLGAHVVGRAETEPSLGEACAAS